MKKNIKLSDLAIELGDLSTPLGLAGNYLAMLQMAADEGQRGRESVLISLIYSKGLDHLQEQLRIIVETVQDAADLLCDCNLVVTKEVVSDGE